MDFLRFPIVLACSLLALQTLIAVPTAVALTGHRQPEEGELLWQDQLNRGGDFGTAVAVQGKRVFAAGFSQSLTTEDTDFVRAYDARTGRLLWERQSPKRGNSEDVLLAVEGHLVFATLSNHIRAHVSALAPWSGRMRWAPPPLRSRGCSSWWDIASMATSTFLFALMTPQQANSSGMIA